ncbi:Sporulation domain-containing protein [Legionella maceachernii]|uniref:Sporulation domain-containing protein n=2 Tax=Legionellaceae TaxID=444 RepID=A0A0W0W1I8_9GAMM|nr:Sporulation domain-containing protein [Legionella maceachernii]SJZ71936.1 DedD protein [Legionella maceachernii]SUP02397.1 rare lipoprotein A [Legionella maceachernii]
MKLVIDERVKHRLIGLAVILSIGAIFAPAIMKKSNQRIDGNVNVSVELPPKPLQPDVAIAEKNTLFENAKVAHVELPEVANEEQPLPALAKAEPLSRPELNSRTVEPIDEQTLAQNRDAPNLESESFAREDQAFTQEKVTASPTVSTTNVAVVHKIAKADAFLPKPKSKVVVKNNKLIKPVAKVKPKLSLVKPKPIAKPVVKRIAKQELKGGYAIQLATFTRQKNADSLISRLKGKGYQASYKKVKTSEGIVYKVIVGQVRKREQAKLLQKQLASAVQIRGFIVTTNQG